MKKIFTTLLAVFFSVFAFSQSYIEIGDGTASSSFPYNAWNYTWSKALYKADQMQGSKTITKIAIDYKSGSEKTLNNQKIYLKNSDLTALDGAYEDAVSSGYTPVFEGNITFSVDGWKIIDLSQGFEYDGTKSLIVLWENRNGSSPYASFNATETTENVIKVSGSDTGFPTVSGFDPYPKALPNIRFYYDAGSAPETPGNEIPASNATKVNIDSDLSFDIGANTTSYDLYLSTDEGLVTSLDASVKVVADAAVGAAGTFSFSPAQPLMSKTEYFWRVVAKNATDETNSPVFSFETERVIATFPYNQGFEDDEIWTEGWYGDMTKTDWFYTSIVGSWNKYESETDPTSSNSGDFSAKCNPSSTSGEYILMTPRINLPENFEISFWWKNTSYIAAKVEGKDKTYVEISTDGTQTWNELGIINPAEESNEWTRSYFDLSTYSGGNVYVRWRYVLSEGQTGIPIYLDDVELALMENLPKISISPADFTFSNLAVGGELSTTITISNIGSTDLVITDLAVDAPFSAAYSGTLAPNDDADVVVNFNPTAAGAVSKTLTVNITGDYSGENTLNLSGEAEELTSTLFQPFDLSTDLPEGWQALNNPEHQYTKVGVIATNFDSYSPSNVAKFVVFSDNAYPVSLVTPGLDGFDANELSFFAKAGGDYSVDLVIGTQLDPYSTDSFVEVDRVTLTNEYVQYKPTIPTDNTRPYVVFRHGGNPVDYSVTSIWLDDVSWQPAGNNPPSPSDPVKPTDSQVNVDIMMPLTFQWIKNAGEPTGYKFSLGTNAEANNIIDGEIIDGGNNVIYTPDVTFNFATNYKWKVVPYNAYGDASDCPVWSFTTMNDPLVTSLPYSENFDNVTNASGFTYPLGWSIENPGSDNICWDIISNSEVSTGNAYSAPNAMHVAFHPFNPKNDYLFTPPVQLEANRSYAIDFRLQTLQDMVTGLVYNEKVKVLVGNSNTSAAMTTEILDTMTNQLGWKNPEAIFSPETNGNYYFAFKAYSEANQYLLIIDNVKIQKLFSVTFNVTDSLGEDISDAVLTLNGTAQPAGSYSVNLLKAGSYSYSISKEGFVTQEGTVVVDEDETVEIELLENRYQVTFNVVDQDEAQITDAIVTFNEVENAAGDYSVSDVLAGTYTYTVEKDGYIAATGEVEVTNEDVTVDAELVLIVHTVTFTVLDEYEEPITDAVINFSEVEYEAGGYVLDNIVPGTYSYSVFKSGYDVAEGEVVVSDDTAVDVTLYLSRFTVTFTVEDTEGNAISDAILTFNDEVFEAGVYEIPEVLADTYSYSVAKEGYSSFFGEVTVTDSDVTVNVELEPHQVYTVTFVVVDAESSPITDATVTFNTVELEPGDYVISDLESGNYNYSVVREGYETVNGNVIVNDDVTVDITLQVPVYEYTVTFTVTDSDEQPVAGATITFTEVDDEITTNAEGIATISLENGDYNYTVNLDGYAEHFGSVTVNSEDVDVAIQMQTVGIFENSVLPLSVCPNPATNLVWVTVPEGVTGEFSLTIISITGRIIDSFVAANSIQVNLDKYPKGTYIVCLKSVNHFATAKLIVQ